MPGRFIVRQRSEYHCDMCATSSKMNESTADFRLAAVDKTGSQILLVDCVKVRTKSLAVPLTPHEMLLCPTGDKLWVSIYGSGTFRANPAPGREIVEVDVESWTLKRSFNIWPFTSPHGLTMDRFGVLWTSCDPHGVVLAVDVANGKVLDAVETGSFGTHWVLAAPRGDVLFTSNKDDEFISVIDPRERRLKNKVSVPHGTEGLGFSPDGRWLFAADHRRPQVLLIDVEQQKMVRTIDLTDLPWDGSRTSHHMRLRCSPDSSILAVSSYHTDRLVLLDMLAPSRQRTVNTGRGPMALAFDPDHTHQLYVSNHDEGTISVYDTRTGNMLRTFPCGLGIESMEFLPALAEASSSSES